MQRSSRRSLSEMTPGAVLLEEGRRVAPERIRRTAYLRRHDADSEAEVKARARDGGRVMYHCQIGSTDWPSTAAVLEEIEGSLAERGMACDRFEIGRAHV